MTTKTAIVAFALALNVHNVSAETIINANFDSSDPGSLVGPAGGSGETWNNAMRDNGQGDPEWSQAALLDSTGTATGISYTMANSGSGLYQQGSTTNLTMLSNGVFINSETTTLTVSGLNASSTYDFYFAGFSSNWTVGADFTTGNTTATLGTQTYEWDQTDQSTAWVQGQNYILFEDVVPDESGDIVITSVRGGKPYSFFSGFQLVENAPAILPVTAITNFSYDGLTGSSEVTIKGAANTRYKLVEAADLDFTDPDQDLIPLTGATVGALDQNGVVTDANGDATVQFSLATTKKTTFLRMEEYPEATGAELSLLPAVRGGYSRKVVIIGTSLSNPTYGDWPALMEPWLKGEAPDPSKVTVVNLSQSGSSSQTGGINKLASIKAENPDTVFMEFSMNDAYVPYDMSQAQSLANHNFILNDLRADNPDIEIIIQTMNNPEGSGLGPRPEIAAYYQVARDFATAQGLLLIDHNVNWLNLYNTDLPTWNTYVADGVHPSATGYEAIMIPELQQALEPIAQ